MVKKLYKYEFMSLLRWVLPIDAFCLIMALLLRAGIEIVEYFPESGIAIAGTVLVGMTFFLYIILMSIAAFWLVVVRFYKHLLSSEGYLTFTIPVSTTTHLVCKLVCGTTVSLLNGAITVLSVIISFGGLASSLFEWSGISLFGSDGILSVPEVIPHFVGFVLVLIVMSISSAAYALLLPYTSMCLGQLSRKNKIAMSVLWYFVVNTVISTLAQIVSIVFTFIAGPVFESAMDSGTLYGALTGMLDMYTVSFGIAALQSITFGIIGFLVCRHILATKLNLE